MKLLLQDLIKLHDQDKLIGQFNCDNDAYHASPGYSASNLIDVLKYSEAHLKYFKENPETDNESFRIGTMIHTAVLEPNDFDNIYAISPNLDKRTKGGKEMFAQFSLENEGKIIISQKDYDMAMGIQHSVWSTATAKVLLKDALIEQSFYWRDRDTLCKARPDAINKELGVLIDLKTTTNCSEYNLRNSIKDYMYHVQSAFHMTGVNTVFGDVVRDVVYIFVEKTPPYGVKFVTVSKEDLLIGCRSFDKALGRIVMANDTGIFPGYSEEIISLDIFGGKS